MKTRLPALRLFLFGLIVLLFDWPMVALFLERPFHAAFVSLFAAMALCVLALALMPGPKTDRRSQEALSGERND